MEEVGDAGGYHQALLGVPRHRRELKTDGTIWREAIYGYDRLILPKGCVEKI